MGAQTDAKEALFKAIKSAVEDDIPKITNAGDRARTLSELALAYRYASGGAQPGSSVVEK